MDVVLHTYFETPALPLGTSVRITSRKRSEYAGKTFLQSAAGQQLDVTKLASLTVMGVCGTSYILGLVVGGPTVLVPIADVEERDPRIIR